MYNDINRQDITEYFNNLVASDPRLSKYTKDLGVISLGNELGFKIDEAINNIRNQFTEYYEPSSEVVLLAKLMYEIGYLRLHKPLIVSCTIVSGEDVVLEKHQRFTDGVDLFILEDSVSLTANSPETLLLTRGTVRTITSTVDVDSQYHKVDLATNYRKLYAFEARRGVDILEYSQTFVTESSDVSLEVNIGGALSLVARRNNIHGGNVLLGDTIEVDVFETEPSDTVPTSMAIIGNFNIQCTNIVKEHNYEPYLSITDMQRILKFNKNINNSIVYNEDYRSLIRAHIRGIDFIKVWQQEDEDRESGATACNINKVFCSYIPTVVGTNLDSDITNLVKDTVYGKFIIMRAPQVQQIDVEIIITNNSKKSIPQVKQDEIKSVLSGYYDDVEKRLSKAILYKNIVAVLRDHDIDVDVRMSNKNIDVVNALFYKINIGNIIITILERDA